MMDVQTEYYVRLLLLLVKGGMQACKGIIIRELGSTGLDVVLKPLEPVLKKKLIKSQYFMLFPKSGKPDVEDLDLSLLTVVLLDVFILSPSDVKYVKVIKQIRNQLAHNAEASVDQTKYNTMKTDLDDALTKLCKGLVKTLQKECSDLIQKYTTEPLDEMTVIKYVKELRNDDELLQGFEEILENKSADIKQEIKASESRMQEQLTDIMDEIQKLQIEQTSEDTFQNKMTDALPDCELCCTGNNINTAMWYCEFCSRFMCSECKGSMHSNDRNHNCQRIVKGKPIKLDMNGLNLCDLHAKSLAYVCKEDDSLCCEKCLEEQHEQCQNVVSISEIEEGSTFSPTLEILRLQNEAKLAIAWTDSVTKDLNKEIEKIPAHLERQRNTLFDMFDREAQILKDKANALQNKTLKEMSINRMHCENAVEKIDLAKRSLINIAKCGSCSQKLIAKFRMREFENKVKPLTRLKIVTFDLEQIRISDQNLLQSEALSLQVKTLDATPVKLFPVASVELNQSEDEEIKPVYSGLDFLPDGRLVAVDNYNKKCLIFNEKLEKVGLYQLSYYPQSVVAVSEEEVAITSGKQHKIDFLRVSKSNKITLVRTCKVESEYVSICIKDGANFVVGTIDDARPVRIVSLSGDEKDFNINFSDKKYPLDTSASTYIRNKDKVVLTDRYEDIVYIYDTATRNVVKDDQIKGPRGVAVGPFDSFFASSSRTDSIVQLSPSGRIITSHKLNMKRPSFIGVAKDKSRLAISNCSPNKRYLQLFNIVF